ncbi:MAG: Polyhydroxybutyrate depolymerase [Massilia sp.]|nr:Polyhydroxybutyrate depolymerase [Massilia sp.]
MLHPITGVPAPSRNRPWRLLGLAAVAWCAIAQAAERLPALHADAKQVSVSGISSGGYMAVQFHVAFSASVIGAGVVAGGPYYCAQNRASVAVSSCMVPDSGHPLPAVEQLVAFTQLVEQAGAVDSTANLKNSKVWLFSGRKDVMVKQPVMTALQRYYLNFVPPTQVVYLNTVDAGHAFPTVNFGNACQFTGPPLIDKCGIDGAGALLQHIHGALAARGAAPAASLMEFDQREFFDGGDAYSHSMRNTGFAYIPAACRQAACRVHVAFHGCLQNVDAVDDSFTRHAGYNEWADTNRFIVLYPQTITRHGPGFRPWRFSFVLNPLGCWDWWGYDSANYYRKDGPQMRAVMKMIQRLSSTSP